MTTITITGKQPGKTDVTISSTVNPAVKTVVPVTVLSRNLLSYGPASGSGLTATVNSDGSLHVTGTAAGQWRGLSWTFPCPVQGTVKLSGTGIAGLSFNIKCLDAKGQQLGDQMNLGNSVMAIPAGRHVQHEHLRQHHRRHRRVDHAPPVQNRLTSLALCTIHSNHHERSHSLDGLEKIRSVGA